MKTAATTKLSKKTLDLLKNFSNFMIGALALAIVLLGSIVYPMIKNPKEQPKTRRTPAKKKPAAKKPVAKKTTTTRRTVKK